MLKVERQASPSAHMLSIISAKETETAKEVTFSDIFGGKEKLLEGKSIEQLNLLELVFAARVSYRKGDRDAFKRFPRDPKTKKIVKDLERELAVIHSAIPIDEVGGPPVTESALVVHGEVDIGELDNQEGML